jgi:hypothetical protein
MLQSSDNEILKDARWDEQGFYVSWESIIPLREYLIDVIFTLQSEVRDDKVDAMTKRSRQLLKDIGVNLAP